MFVVLVLRQGSEGKIVAKKMKRELPRGKNRPLRRRIRIFQGLFRSAFPNHRGLVETMGIRAGGHCVQGELGPVDLPAEIQRFDVELDLQEGTFAGLSYLICPGWGWTVAVYSRNGKTRKWGHVHSEILGALYEGQTQNKRYIVPAVNLYYFLKESDWNLGIGQIRVDGTLCTLPPRATFEVSKLLDERKKKPAQLTRTYSFHTSEPTSTLAGMWEFVRSTPMVVRLVDHIGRLCRFPKNTSKQVTQHS